MREERKEFKDYLKDNRKKFIEYFIIILVIVVLVLLKNYIFSPYIYNRDGHLTAVKNRNGESVSVHLRVEKKGKSSEKDAVLNFGKKGKKERTSFDDAAYELENEMTKVVEHVERQRGKCVNLPDRGPEGLEFCWTAEKNYRPLLLPFLYPVFLYSFFYGEKQKEKRKKREFNRNIKRKLPSFNHQLVLLLNSGLVFSDAFERIASGYTEKRGKKEPFEELIISIYEESCRGTESLMTVLSEYSFKLGHREFSRLVSVITEHEYRGSDLREKLMDESSILWAERKKDAEAAGKTGETKLSFPLAVLLIVLIMITAAPAVLEM